MQSVVQRLTKNKDLQTVFCYAWGDFGTEPSKASFLMMADLNNHFLKNGAFYPVGGSSEIAINIVPVIERAGGKVLVRADVKGSYPSSLQGSRYSLASSSVPDILPLRNL